MHPYPPGTRIGPYEIASRPLHGGMGVVYFCLDHAHPERPVALKTFLPQFLPDRAARDRFLREGTAWVELGYHPHIVRCYKVTYEDPVAYLALELIAKDSGMDNASLRPWLGQPMPLARALLFALQIARGLEYASAKIPGFVHRDLKPENVLVGADKLPGTDVNRLRVTDFGLAAVLAERRETAPDEPPTDSADLSRTQLTRGAVGTPYYMAPEQWYNQPVGAYTDIYALGCILFEMLTGKLAASGRSLDELKATHCEGRLRPLPGDLPAGPRALLARCLALRPQDRFATWSQVTCALEAAYAALGVGSVSPVEPLQVESVEERQQAGRSFNELGQAYLHLGKAAVAASYFERALTIARETGDRWCEGAALNRLGLVYARLGDPRRAIGSYEQALVIDRETGDRRGEDNALGNLGNAYLQLGDPRRAIGYYEQALAIDREIGDLRGVAIDSFNMARLYYQQNDPARALPLAREAAQAFARIGHAEYARRAGAGGAVEQVLTLMER